MEQNQRQHPDGCMCMMCHGGRHRLLRLILGIILLVVVFCIGVRVGEFKAAIGYYGYGTWPGMMENGNYGYAPQNSYYGPGGMMRYYYQNVTQATSTK